MPWTCHLPSQERVTNNNTGGPQSGCAGRSLRVIRTAVVDSLCFQASARHLALRAIHALDLVASSIQDTPVTPVRRM